MPTIGGVNIGYDVTTPADTESAGLGDDRIRSLKTSLQQGFDAEHNFPAAGGANTGYHVLGSARPFYGTQSVVSSSGSDGRLMLTSDTSRLFAVGSGGTVLLGDTNLLSVGTTTGIDRPQRAYWATEFGNATTDSGGNVTVTFPNSGFSGIPYTVASALSTGGVASVAIVNVISNSASTVALLATTGAGVGVASYRITWMSIGSRTL